MGRESEAGYNLQPEASPTQLRSRAYSNTQDTQLQLHNPPPQSRSLSHPSSTSSYQHSAVPSQPTWKRFAIPTKSDSLSSGFPFHPHLYNLKINHDQWHLFTSEVVKAAKMTAAEDYLAWTAGITAGTVSTAVLLPLGPVVGYYSGKAIHKKTLVKTVKEKLGEEGGLRGVLRKWNEQIFAAKGFEAWLELPRTSGELQSAMSESTVELEATSAGTTMSDKKRKKVEKKAAKRFRIILIPLGETDDMRIPSTDLTFVGTEGSSVSSESGGTISAERGSVGGPDKGDGHQQSQPPAYWDTNAVDRYNAVTASSGDRHPAGSPAATAPTPPPQAWQEPHESDIRYSRAGGFTNT